MIKIYIRNEKHMPKGFRLPEPKSFDGNSDGEITIDFDEMSAEMTFTPTDNKQVIRNTSMFITYFGTEPTMETLNSGVIVLFNYFANID